MLKKTITYTDYDGNERTEDFYFNLTKAELTEMEMSTEGGLGEKIKRIVDAKDVKEIMAIFKDLILKAYGQKSDDGKRFIKSKELTDAFVQTEAYSELFMTLVTKENEATSFINNIIPKDLVVSDKE